MVEMSFGFVLGFAVELRPVLILRLRVTWVIFGSLCNLRVCVS